jgi:hypothetical protein
MIENQLKVMDKYINTFHPHIHEITSLDDVRVIGSRGYYAFCYGNQAVLAIKLRSQRSGYIAPYNSLNTNTNYNYYIKGILGFSNTISGLLSLTNDEFNDLTMEWIRNKHPQIDSYHKLYDFCKSNSVSRDEAKYMFE